MKKITLLTALLLFSLSNIYAQNADAGGDQETCDGTIQLAGNTPTTGTAYWTILAGGGTFENSTDPTTTVTNLYEGANTFVWNFEDNGTSDEVTITNNIFYTSAGPDQSVVLSSATMQALEPDAGQTATWSIIGGAGNFGGDYANNQATVTDLGYGPNTFRWYVYDNNTGCDAYDDVIITYISYPNENHAGEDQTICGDSTRMDAVSPSAGTIAYWSITSGNCDFVGGIDNPNIDVINIAPGILTLRWNEERNGVSTYDEVIIYNYSFETNAGTNQDLCENNTQLNASSVLGNSDLPANENWTGTWDIIAGNGAVSNSSAQNTDITNLYEGQPGITTLRWKVERTDYPGSESCFAISNVNLYFYDMPEPDFTANPEDEGCHPFEATLTNTTSNEIFGTEYDWYFDGNLGSQINVGHDEIINQTFVNPISPYNPENPVQPHDSIYNVRMVSHLRINDNLVCTKEITKPITVFPVPYVGFEISGQGQEFTNPTIIGIENTSSPTWGEDAYSWDFGNGVTPPAGNFEEFFTASYYNWGTYTITLSITNGQCSADSSKEFTIYAPIPQSAVEAASEKSCLPYSHQFWANTEFTTPDISEYTWEIYKQGDETALDQLIEQNPIYEFTKAGKYFAKLFASGEGSIPPWSYTYIRTDTIEINGVEIDENLIYVNKTDLSTKDSLLVTYNIDNENNYTFSWDFGDNNILQGQELSYLYSKEGDYYLTITITDQNECENNFTLSEMLSVNDDIEGEILFADAFAPDPNGGNGGYEPNISNTNSVFIPVSKGVEEFTMEIFNKQGVMIFRTDNVAIGWDGYIDGQMSPMGAYIYKAEGRFTNGELFKYVGSILLIK